MSDPVKDKDKLYRLIIGQLQSGSLGFHLDPNFLLLMWELNSVAKPDNPARERRYAVTLEWLID